MQDRSRAEYLEGSVFAALKPVKSYRSLAPGEGVRFGLLQPARRLVALLRIFQQMRSTFSRCHCGVYLLGSFGASEATIFSKRGSPRSGSQTGCSFKAP